MQIPHASCCEIDDRAQKTSGRATKRAHSEPSKSEHIASQLARNELCTLSLDKFEPAKLSFEPAEALAVVNI